MKKFMVMVFLFQLTGSLYFLQAQTKYAFIPDEVRNHTLLVMKAEKGILQKMFNNKLERALKEHYDGPFVLVGKEELKGPIYADTSKYRYVLNVEEVGMKITVTTNEYNHKVAERREKIVDVFFFDRSNNVRYPNAGFENMSYITALRILGEKLQKL